MTRAKDQPTGLARLVVEVGSPREQGGSFSLTSKLVIVGRAARPFQPDIAFDSLLVSRRHCCIRYEAGQFALADLGSKHGTVLNSTLLEPHVYTVLEHGAQIGLAAGVVLLRFLLAEELEATLDFEDVQTTSKANCRTAVAQFVIVDPAKRTLSIHGRELGLAGKEWRLLELLYNHRNQLVTYETIRLAVWPERCIVADGLPDVGFDEVNALIYRLRRKLGAYAGLLKTRRGQGCMLEIPG